MSETLNLNLKIWRQANSETKGSFKSYKLTGISTEMSFLEMLDVLNEQLIERDEEPVAFDHDCREGICGTCGVVINGQAHGPDRETTTCQLHMRRFHDGDTIVIEPWRASAFPVVKDDERIAGPIHLPELHARRFRGLRAGALVQRLCRPGGGPQGVKIGVQVLF